MANDVTTFFAQQFTDRIKLLAQQVEVRLTMMADQGDHAGSQQAVAVDQIAPLVARRRTTRYAQVIFDDPVISRRWVSPSPFENNLPFDNVDKLQMLGDPRSNYAQTLVNAMHRQEDDDFLTAMFGTAKTGVDGTTSELWSAYTATQQVAQTVGASAAVDLNVAKVRAGKKILMKNEVDMGMDPLTIAVSASSHDALLAETQVVSTDFNNAGSRDQPVLKEGLINRFIGVNFIHTERIQISPSGTYYSIPMWAKSGMHWGTWAGVATRIDQRIDLEGAPWQVKVTGMWGATRLEGKKIVEILCTQS